MKKEKDIYCGKQSDLVRWIVYLSYNCLSLATVSISSVLETLGTPFGFDFNRKQSDHSRGYI